MQMSNRKSVRALVTSSLMLIGALSAAAAGATESKKADEAASCKEEMRRVAVWQQGGNPKFNNHPRFEERLVTVCDGKVVHKPEQRNASAR